MDYDDLFCMHPGITVGLIQTSYNAPEIGGPLSVCVEMFDGDLERNISLTLSTSDDTAIGMTCSHVLQCVQSIIASIHRTAQWAVG